MTICSGIFSLREALIAYGQIPSSERSYYLGESNNHGICTLAKSKAFDIKYIRDKTLLLKTMNFHLSPEDSLNFSRGITKLSNAFRNKINAVRKDYQNSFILIRWIVEWRLRHLVITLNRLEEHQLFLCRLANRLGTTVDNTLVRWLCQFLCPDTLNFDDPIAFNYRISSTLQRLQEKNLLSHRGIKISLPPDEEKRFLLISDIQIEHK